MHQRTIDILTSHAVPIKRCVMGNVAIARGAIEAGVRGVFAYPGTPSTEISEVFAHVDDFQGGPEGAIERPGLARGRIHFEYSINEKIALEKAIAFSIGGRGALCVMKNVGMNVASDALMSITYQTIVAPLVIVVCDDPGCHSSSNEQDSRHWGPMAGVPMFDPSCPDEALRMTRDAFTLSAALRLPVIVRTTTRVSHARGVARFGPIDDAAHPAHFDRLAEHINIPARTAGAHVRLLEKLARPEVRAMHERHAAVEGARGAAHGIIATGVARTHLDEILHRHGLAGRVAVLHLGLVHPFPGHLVAGFLSRDGLEQVMVLEELDPVIENATRATAQRAGSRVAIHGKGFAGLSPAGEFTPDLLEEAVRAFLGSPLGGGGLPLDDMEEWTAALPPRPPVLCAGCPHRATFYLLKLSIPRGESDMILCGDIGCFGLGALPPLKMIDTINHMGMSISMAQGLGEAFRSAGQGRKVVALVGDGTFFHSGLASLVNAVYTRANILVVIFDNRTIGMTGHQAHPGASQRLPKYHQIDLVPVLRGLGIGVVEEMDPFDLRDGARKLRKAMDHDGVSVLVARAPCIFLPDFAEKVARRMRIVVDERRCNTCGNHADLALTCSRAASPQANLSRARARLLAEEHVPGEEQQCPANICNHAFFNTILEGDPKGAVEIVRDKMLFARTCGEVCHRPCELFSDAAEVVPIKALKHAVSELDDNYRDFEKPKARARAARPNGKRVAVVGAGPAGLSAAYDLLQAGYGVEIFEKEDRPGGMAAFGIPAFRMDKEAFHYEAMQLAVMGARFHFGRALDGHLTLDHLATRHDAVVLAIGMGRAKTLEIIERGVPPERRSDALAFLRAFNLGRRPIDGPGTVLVIGGGNSAIDAARAAKRLDPANRIIVSCIETEADMPAFAEEVGHARAEGIELVPASRVRGCEAGEAVRVVLQAVAGGGDLATIECHHVITAIGQLCDEDALAGIDERDRDAQGRIAALDATGLNNVVVAGDLRAGNHASVIGAIASGKDAAVRVRHLLEGYSFGYEGAAALHRLNTTPPSRDGAASNGIPSPRDRSWARFDLHQACMKCDHCVTNFGCPAMIKVDGKVRIDQSRCTLCGLCIDVCPNGAIHWERMKEPEPIPLPVP